MLPAEAETRRRRWLTPAFPVARRMSLSGRRRCEVVLWRSGLDVRDGIRCNYRNTRFQRWSANRWAETAPPWLPVRSHPQSRSLAENVISPGLRQCARIRPPNSRDIESLLNVVSRRVVCWWTVCQRIQVGRKGTRQRFGAISSQSGPGDAEARNVNLKSLESKESSTGCP